MKLFAFASIVSAVAFGSIFGATGIIFDAASSTCRPVDVDVSAMDLGEDKASIADSDEQVGHPSFMSPHSSPIAMLDDRVFVVNRLLGSN